MIRKDIKMTRGDKKDFSLDVNENNYFEFEGDYTSDKVVFGVKQYPGDASRVFEKMNTVAGGSDSELTATLSGGYTVVVPKILPANTKGLSGTYYHYEITREDASDSTDYSTLAHGILKLQGDVLRPTDGTGNSPAAERKYYMNYALTGTKNSVNLTFTVGKVIATDADGNPMISVYLNNTRLVKGTHYSVSIGSSDTTITIIEGTYQQAPASGDNLVADFVEA